MKSSTLPEEKRTAMTSFPTGIAFTYPWRKYQQRVLDELQEHFNDGHLHVIAPPGSGKTVLGLEVAIRLNQPTLILAPTLAIRNQWIQRFCELFLQTALSPDWISRDIRNPEFLTVVTYQGLHAACNNQRIDEEDPEDEKEADEKEIRKAGNRNLSQIVEGLKAKGIKTIVVDEAHHLKNEWWHTLGQVKKKLDPFIVGLTATPPYDVSPNEWQRYLELNGPVDTEITVPELVIEGDLCPHQDYVHLSLPTAQENQSIQEFRRSIEKLFGELLKDDTLLQAIENHPAWIAPTAQLDWIYNNLSCYSASLIYLHARGKMITEHHLQVIGDHKLKIPSLDYGWMEVLLHFYLFQEKEHFKAYEAHRTSLEKRLRRYAALEGRHISLSHNKKLSGLLTSSCSKLSSIQEIVDFEHQQLGKELRLVILSDYIRKEFYVNAAENTLSLTKLGVIPIFEKLRRTNSNQKKLGVLTGSMIILPKTALAAFEEQAAFYGIAQINAAAVPFDPDYVLIHQSEQLKHEVVQVVTQIFQQGALEVLIGTKSLLGEGWDAPAINSLVLASVVGSFVLSNQMRGRAIRTQKENAAKTSNIWHLACIDPSAPGGGEDYEMLRRRFRSFVGISCKDGGGIENGLGRLNPPQRLDLSESLECYKKETFALAADRNSLSERWTSALSTGVSLVEEIKIPFAEERGYQKSKSLSYRKTIANLMAMLAFGTSIYTLQALQLVGRSARNIHSLEDLFIILSVLAGLGVLVYGKLAYNAYRLYLSYRDISEDLQHIGQALLNTLLEAGCMHTKASSLKVEASADELGAIYCHLEGGTTFEKSVFINALQEVIGPVGNPRYVIIRKSAFAGFLQQKDYHSVPELLGRNKVLAEHFQQEWLRLVGNCSLVFTRTLEGRKLILKSRVASLAAQFEEGLEHVNKWR